MAKYIVKQYTAASGGEVALDRVESMYAMGKVKMGVTEFCAAKTQIGKRKKKMVRIKNLNNGNGGEMGGFVLWKKGSSQWSLELVVSGCKVSAGCDGNVAWKQSPWLAHSNEPSGPLKGFFKGLILKPQQICLLDRFAWEKRWLTMKNASCLSSRHRLQGSNQEAKAVWRR